MDAQGNDAIRRVVEAVWREVLQRDRVGPDDNFFDLGGTSFEAVMVVSRLNAELGADVSDIGLFARPTIRAMTELLRTSGALAADEPATDRPAPSAEEARRRGERRRALGEGSRDDR